MIANDLAYGEVYFEEAPRSILEVPGGIDVAIEFHSLSKSFNMTGWRIGWAVGNAALIAALGQVKGNADSGQFNAIQVAGTVALQHFDHPDVKKQMAIYRERRDALYDGLTGLGWKFRKPKAGFFCWVNTPNPYSPGLGREFNGGSAPASSRNATSSPSPAADSARPAKAICAWP